MKKEAIRHDFPSRIFKKLKALIIWSLVLGALVFMVLSMYSTFASQQEGLQSMLDAYPEPLKKMFGMDQLDFTTIIGFFAIEAYMMITLFGSIYAAMLAANIIAKEENEKTIEFLLSKPVTRTNIVSSKLLTVILNLIIFNLFIALVSLLGFQTAGDAEAPMDTFTLLVIGGFFTHLVFAAVAFLLSTMLRRSRNIWSAAIGIVFVTYFIDAIAGLVEQTEFLKHFSPFRYFNATYITTNNALHSGYTILSAGIIIVCIATAYVYYRKKDISV